MVTDDEFRSLMAGVVAPVTVVTTAGPDGPAGTTVSAFASLSLHPPLVSVAFARDSSLLGQIQRTGRFGINILAHGQEAIAALFARRGVDRFGSVPWHDDHGLPRLAAASGWAACELYKATGCCSAWAPRPAAGTTRRRWCTPTRPTAHIPVSRCGPPGRSPTRSPRSCAEEDP